MSKMTLVFKITDKEKFKEFHRELLQTMLSKGTPLEEKIGAILTVSAYGDIAKREEILEKMVGIYEEKIDAIPREIDELEKQLEETYE